MGRGLGELPVSCSVNDGGRDILSWLAGLPMHQPAPGVSGVHGHQNNEDGELGAGEVVRNSDVRDPTLRRGRVPAYGKYVAVLICRIQRVL